MRPDHLHVSNAKLPDQEPLRGATTGAPGIRVHRGLRLVTRITQTSRNPPETPRLMWQSVQPERQNS